MQPQELKPNAVVRPNPPRRMRHHALTELLRSSDWKWARSLAKQRANAAVKTSFFDTSSGIGRFQFNRRVDAQYVMPSRPRLTTVLATESLSVRADLRIGIPPSPSRSRGGKPVTKQSERCHQTIRDLRCCTRMLNGLKRPATKILMSPGRNVWRAASNSSSDVLVGCASLRLSVVFSISGMRQHGREPLSSSNLVAGASLFSLGRRLVQSCKLRRDAVNGGRVNPVDLTRVDLRRNRIFGFWRLQG